MQTQITAPPINYLELRVCGLMRSGNHAIIEWVMNQHADKPACFLNNIRHGHYDPYVHYRQRVIQQFSADIDVENLRHAEKHLLICSFEDRVELQSTGFDFLHSALRPDLEGIRRKYLLRSQHFIDLLIIRDPFNCLASRFRLLQTRGAMGGIDDYQLIVYNWKQVARAALGIIAYPDASQLLINYNRWLTNKAYRRQLSARLHGVFSDTSLGRLSSFGGGSSFPATNARNIVTANSVNTDVFFQRWQEMSTNSEFRKAMADPEILALSEKIFGEIPGTREFMQQLIRG